MGTHRKLILPPGFEGDHFQIGKDYSYFDYLGFKFATLICYDVEFPENVRNAAIGGAEVILVPTALDKEWKFVAQTMVPTRAFESGVFLCYANHSGVENDITYLGSSCIISPSGNVLARADERPELIRASISKSEIKRAQERLPYLRDLLHLPKN